MADNLAQDVSRFGMDMSKDMAQLFSTFFSSIGTKAELVGGRAELDELQRYAKKGGSLEQISFDRANLANMEECLRKENVMYSIIGVKNSDKVVCIYKDSDSYKVNLATERFNAINSVGINELSPDRFLEVFKDEQVNILKDIDTPTLELMRNHLQQEDSTFTVVKNNNDKYDIIYPQNHEIPIQKAMKRTSWDLASPMADAIKNEIKQKVEARDKITSLLDDVKAGKPTQNILLVDSKNPNRYVEITNNGFSVHNLTTKIDVIPDEAQRKMRPAKLVEDVKTEEILKSDKNFEKSFFKVINSMNDSLVTMKPSEYVLYDKNKEFIEVDDAYLKQQHQFIENIKQIDKIYPKGYTVCTPIEENIKTIKNLTDEEEFELYQALKGIDKEAYVLKDKELSYKEDYAEVIEPIIEHITINKEDIEALNQLRLKGYDIDKDKNLIIMDKEDPSKGPFRIENKSQIYVLTNDSSWESLHTSKFSSSISEFKHPIVLTVDEYQEINSKTPAEKITSIDAKVSEIEHSSTEDALKNNEEMAKKSFERDTFYENGKLNDTNIRNDERTYNNKHLKKAIAIASAFTVEVIAGKQISREIENVSIKKGVDRHSISR